MVFLTVLLAVFGLVGDFLVAVAGFLEAALTGFIPDALALRADLALSLAALFL